jgi:hypothetical protein
MHLATLIPRTLFFGSLLATIAIVTCRIASGMLTFQGLRVRRFATFRTADRTRVRLELPVAARIVSALAAPTARRIAAISAVVHPPHKSIVWNCVLRSLLALGALRILTSVTSPSKVVTFFLQPLLDGHWCEVHNLRRLLASDTCLLEGQRLF